MLETIMLAFDRDRLEGPATQLAVAPFGKRLLVFDWNTLRGGHRFRLFQIVFILHLSFLAMAVSPSVGPAAPPEPAADDCLVALPACAAADRSPAEGQEHAAAPVRDPAVPDSAVPVLLLPFVYPLYIEGDAAQGAILAPRTRRCRGERLLGRVSGHAFNQAVSFFLFKMRAAIGSILVLRHGIALVLRVDVELGIAAIEISVVAIHRLQANGIL